MWGSVFLLSTPFAPLIHCHFSVSPSLHWKNGMTASHWRTVKRAIFNQIEPTNQKCLEIWIEIHQHQEGYAGNFRPQSDSFPFYWWVLFCSSRFFPLLVLLFHSTAVSHGLCRHAYIRVVPSPSWVILYTLQTRLIVREEGTWKMGFACLDQPMSPLSCCRAEVLPLDLLYTMPIDSAA